MKREDKILDLGGLLTSLEPLRADGRTVAFANGLFDILHVGHLRYLLGAKEEADLLVVAINSDNSAPVSYTHLRAHET